MQVARQYDKRNMKCLYFVEDLQGIHLKLSRTAEYMRYRKRKWRLGDLYCLSFQRQLESRSK